MKVRVDPGKVIGEINPWIYGQFSEHLHKIVYDGIWSELLAHRKFELPSVQSHGTAVPAQWEVIETLGAHVRRDEHPEWAGQPGADSHHHVSMTFRPGRPGGYGGIKQTGIALDAGCAYVAEARLSSMAMPLTSLRFSLLDHEGKSLTDVDIEIDPQPPVSGMMDLMSRYGQTVVRGTLVSPVTTDAGGFAVTADPRGEHPTMVFIKSLSLMPADNIDGLHAAVIDAVRGLPPRIVKWPGGCFADSYDWRLAIGPRHMRHGAVNYAWCVWDENDYGTDEYLRFSEAVGATPYICVNHGTLNAEVAAAWVEYCNGDEQTRWGTVRASNGHRDPYAVKLWAIGNEVYGPWERGHVEVDQYADNIKRFAAAMKAVDPTIKLVAQGFDQPYTKRLLELVGAAIDYVSIHYYSEGIDPKSDRDAYIKKGRSFDEYLGEIVSAIRSTPGAEHVRIALDEWGWTAEPDDVAALYCATVLNGLSRVAPYVQIACKVSVVNPQATIQRIGQRVTTNPMYRIFQLFNAVHRSSAIAAQCDGAEIDVSAYKDANGISVIVANSASDGRSVDIELGVEGPLTVHRIRAHDISSDLISGTRLDLDGFEVIAVEAYDR